MKLLKRCSKLLRIFKMCFLNIFSTFASCNETESESDTKVSRLNAATDALVIIILTDYLKNVKIPGGSINRG